MNPNKLYCQANKAVFNELDARVTALEEGGGGTEYTAGTGIDITEDVISVDSETIYDKSDVDDLLDEKQDVLTAGKCISITDDTISLDHGWVEVEATDFSTANIDISQYDYKIEGAGNQSGSKAIAYIDGDAGNGKYFGHVVESDTKVLIHNMLFTPSASGITQSGLEFYINTNKLQTPFTYYDMNGDVITSANYTTYFDASSCIKMCVASHGNVNLGNTIVKPGDTFISVVVFNGSTPQNFTGVSNTVANEYNKIVNGSTADSTKPIYTEFRINNSANLPVAPVKYYRRKKA